MMSRPLTGLATAGALVLSAMSAAAQELPPCRSRSVNVEHGNRAARSKAGVSFLCAQGNLAWIHIETRRTTIAAVLSAMRASYNISYHSSIALDETRDGVYVGSLREVISRLLSNYNYVIKSENSTLDVDIFSKSGELAVAAQMPTEIKAQPERPAHGARRTH
jgi:hypothetical protein